MPPRSNMGRLIGEPRPACQRPGAGLFHGNVMRRILRPPGATIGAPDRGGDCGRPPAACHGMSCLPCAYLICCCRFGHEDWCGSRSQALPASLPPAHIRPGSYPALALPAPPKLCRPACRMIVSSSRFVPLRSVLPVDLPERRDPDSRVSRARLCRRGRAFRGGAVCAPDCACAREAERRAHVSRPFRWVFFAPAPTRNRKRSGLANANSFLRSYLLMNF